MVKEKDTRTKFIFRLQPEAHQALRRMSIEEGVSMGEILNVLIEKNIPKMYFKTNPYDEEQNNNDNKPLGYPRGSSETNFKKDESKNKPQCEQRKLF